MLGYLFNKVTGRQVEIFKNTYFEEHLRTTASQIKIKLNRKRPYPTTKYLISSGEN